MTPHALSCGGPCRTRRRTRHRLSRVQVCAPCLRAFRVPSFWVVWILACSTSILAPFHALAQAALDPVPAARETLSPSIPTRARPPTARLPTTRLLIARPPPDSERGRRLFEASGGCTCHTNYPGEGDDAPELAGGRALETPFGVFYSSNITSDEETGLGLWDDEDFIRAMREGLSPTGEHYYPVFPYPSFTGLRDQDLMDLKAYLDSRPAIRRARKPPGAPFPFSWRATLVGWKWLNFTPRRVANDASKNSEWNRGHYLVRAAAHCGECHTSRTLTGGLDPSLWLAGSRDGPEGELAPNITPDRRTGIGSWSRNDLVWYLETGIKPDGDDTQGLMSEVIEHGYSKMSDADRRAIATYLKSIEAIENRIEKEK